MAVFGIVGVLALVTGGNTQETAAPQTENSVVSDTPSTPAPTTNTSAARERYIDYSDEAVASNADTQRVLFFHAEWCSTCKFFERDIKSADIPSDITIIETDYDTETELKQRYGVTVQSTFVLLDDDGNAVKSWPFASGLSSAQDLYDAVAAEV